MTSERRNLQYLELYCKSEKWIFRPTCKWDGNCKVLFFLYKLNVLVVRKIGTMISLCIWKRAWIRYFMQNVENSLSEKKFAYDPDLDCHPLNNSKPWYEDFRIISTFISLSQPIRSTHNQSWLARAYFPAFRVSDMYLPAQIWLVHGIICVLCDWLVWLTLVLRHSIESFYLATVTRMKSVTYRIVVRCERSHIHDENLHFVNKISLKIGLNLN